MGSGFYVSAVIIGIKRVVIFLTRLTWLFILLRGISRVLRGGSEVPIRFGFRLVAVHARSKLTLKLCGI